MEKNDDEVRADTAVGARAIADYQLAVGMLEKQVSELELEVRRLERENMKLEQENQRLADAAESADAAEGDATRRADDLDQELDAATVNMAGLKAQLEDVADFLYTLTAFLGLPEGTEPADVLAAIQRPTRALYPCRATLQLFTQG